MSGNQPSPGSGPPPIGEFRPGEEFAGYRIEGLVGRGGMGVVYRATELSLGRPIALKVVAPALVDDSLARRRFVREARAAAAIEHPNVIPVHAAGERDGIAFLAMRLIAGDDLRRLVRRNGPLPPERAARFVAQIGAALDAAHRVGIVHRDVKPGNVLVDADDHAYLTDFGLTAFLDSSSTASGAGHWVGTPDFAAPEQIRGERPDARTDVYALGCVLFYLLTARAPFVREGQEAKLWAHLTEPAPSLGVGSPALDAVVARALAKQPAQRYASAGDLARAATAAASGEPIAQEGGSVAVGSAAGAKDSDTRTLEAPTVAQPPEDRPRRRGALLAIVAASAAAIVVAVLALTRHGDPNRNAAQRSTPTPTPTPKATVFAARRVAGASAGHRPTSLALAGDRIWTGERKRPVLRAFAPETLKRLRRVTIPTGVSQLVATPRGLWATMWRAKAIVRLDARTGRIEAGPIALPGTPSTLAVGGGGIYVGLTAPTAGGVSTIMKLDQSTGSVVWAKPLKRQADRLVWLDGSLWAMVSTPNRVFRIDPNGVIREGYDLPGGDADDLTAAGGRLWATVREPDSLVRLDVRTGQRAGVYVGRGPTGVSVHGNDVWVALWYSSQVAVFDARTLKRRGRAIDVALNPFDLTADATGAWVVCAGNARVVRVKKL